MPRIDFICKNCSHQFTEFVKFEDRDKLSCPTCGGDEVKQNFQGKWNGGGSSKSVSSFPPARSGFS